MSDILYSKLRLEVPNSLNGQNATITSKSGATRTVQMSSPITDIMLAGMEKYRVQAGITDEDVSFGYGQIKKIGTTGVSNLSVTTLPTKTQYYTDDALDLSGIVVSATTESYDGGTETKNVTNDCIYSPANGTILTTEGTIPVNVNYRNVITSFNVTCSALPAWDTRGLEYNSWDTIQKYIKAGKFSTVANVGDTKSFVMNGKTYHAEVVAINDGTGDAASWYPDRTVDFICTELYETTYQYNSTNTNTGGFPSSTLRNTLINTLYPLLPSALKNVIIAKSHSYNTSTSGVMGTDSTKLWLPTHYEIIGITDQYATGETSANNKKYTLASLIKNRNGQTSAVAWWLSSLYTYNSVNFWHIGVNGTTGYTVASTARGVPVCFRIG